MIRVFLVCDNPEFCEKLGSFFARQASFEVVGKLQGLSPRSKRPINYYLM